MIAKDKRAIILHVCRKQHGISRLKTDKEVSIKYTCIQLTHWGRDKMADIFQSIFLNENVWILIKISLKFISKDPINNIPALVQITTWRRPGNKSLSEPIVV